MGRDHSREGLASYNEFTVIPLGDAEPLPAYLSRERYNPIGLVQQLCF